ncbi:hypothetical protein [Ornithinibacillus bavariensis]|uniref:hypothetical protein n=1 Tax=Ornithinibacillus bavariensis TaxID=545502 RepID=UPI000ECFC354|nr:hypothetical protein [Ornithinibacillus sp.]
MKSNKRIFLLPLVLGLLLSFSAITAFATQNNNFPKNQAGQTYGSAAMAKSPQEEPDLIVAIGVNGEEGYVYREDLDGEMPSTPEEALAIQKQTEKKMALVAAGTPVVVRTIPLYDVDGVTVIGEFDIINVSNPDRYKDK